MYTTIDEIKANVKTIWYHPNCKFLRGDRVVVNQQVIRQPGNSYVSKMQQRRVGREGHVVAVSCTPDGRIRGQALDGWCNRMYTRYYVQFADGIIFGFHSHHLNAADDSKHRDGVRHDLSVDPHFSQPA